MNIACIATAGIPSDTAHSIQVMKACQALRQIGHRVRLVPRGVFHPARLRAETPDHRQVVLVDDVGRKLARQGRGDV